MERIFVKCKRTESLKCRVFILLLCFVILGGWLVLDISCKKSLKGKSQIIWDKMKRTALDIHSDISFNIKQYI